VILRKDKYYRKKMNNTLSLETINRKFGKENLNTPEAKHLLSGLSEFTFEGINTNFFGRYNTEQYEELLIKLYELYPEATKRTIVNGLNSYKYGHIVRLMFLKARLWKFFSPEEIKKLKEEKKLNIQENYSDLLTGLNPEYNADLFWVDDKDPDLYPGYYDDDRMDEYYEKYKKLKKILEQSYQEFMIIQNNPLGVPPKDLEMLLKCIENKKHNKVKGLLDNSNLFSLNKDNVKTIFETIVKSNLRAIYFSYIDHSILMRYKNLIREEIIRYINDLSESEREDVIKQFNTSKFFEGPVMKKIISNSIWTFKLNIFFFLDENDLEFTFKKRSDIQTIRTQKFQNIPSEMLEEIRRIEPDIYTFLTDETYRRKLSDKERRSLASKFNFYIDEDLYELFRRHTLDLELENGIGEYISELMRSGDEDFLYKALDHNAMRHLNSQQVSDLLDDPHINFLGRAITIFNKNYEKLGGGEYYFFSDLMRKSKTAVFEAILRMFREADLELIRHLFHSDLILQVLYEEEKQSESTSYLKKLIDNPELDFIRKAFEVINSSFIIVNDTNVVERFLNTLKKLSKDSLFSYVESVFKSKNEKEIYNLIKIGILEHVPDDIIKPMLTKSKINLFYHIMKDWKDPSNDFYYIFNEFLDRIRKLPDNFLNEMAIENFTQEDMEIIAFIFDCDFFHLYADDLSKFDHDLVYIIYKKLIKLLGFEYREYSEYYSSENREEAIVDYYFKNVKVDEGTSIMPIIRQALKDSIGEVSENALFEMIAFDLIAVLDDDDINELIAEKEEYLIKVIHPLLERENYEFVEVIIDHFVSRLSNVAGKNLLVDVSQIISEDERNKLLETLVGSFRFFKQQEIYKEIITDLAKVAGRDVKWVRNKEKRYVVFENTLDRVNMKNFNIYDFTPTNNIEGLTKLVLNSCQNPNIENLDLLQELEELEISNSKVMQIEGLPPLKNLKKLDLHRNEITRISGLENFHNLEELNLERNQINRIGGLGNLKNLVSLKISVNKIEEIEELESLINLKHLHLWANKISEIKGLENLTNLRILKLGSNPIKEIKGLDTLKNLEELSLSGTKITELKGLENLDKLKKLDLPYKSKELDKYVQVMGRDGRKYVKFCRTKLKSGHGMVEYDGKTFEVFEDSLIMNNQGISNIRNIEGLDRFTNIKVLDLRDNNIRDLEGLEMLINLENLLIYGNRIQRLSGLKQLTNLKVLKFGHYMRTTKQNNIKILDGAELPPNLEKLDISYNDVSRIKNLNKLKKLKYLSLDNNNISGPEGLENLSSSLEKFIIGQNPITRHDEQLLLEKYRKNKN